MPSLHRCPRQLIRENGFLPASPARIPFDRDPPVARCVRSTSATHHFYFEHSRLVGSQFVTAAFTTGYSSMAQLRFWRSQIPTQRAQGTMTFHDVTTASVDHSALDRRAFSALRIPNDRTSDIPVAAHPDPLVIGFRPFPTRRPQTRLRAPACVSRQDRFHPALREENDAFPARNAFPRQAPFENRPLAGTIRMGLSRWR